MNQLFKKFYFLFILLSFTSKGFAQSNVKSSEPQNIVKFTENKNQWDSKVLYRAQLDGGALFLEQNAFTYNFYDKESLRENHLGKIKNGANLKINSHAFKMTFLGAEKKPETSSKQTTPDYNNYFIGNDKTHWAGNVKNFREVNYKNLYTGIDMQLLGMQNSIKYNFIVERGANADKIKLFYQGLDKIFLEKGALKLTTTLNEMVEQRPYAYQWIGSKRVEVPCEFILENTTVHFNFPNGYDKAYELIIDPVLIFACSSGSLADNFGMTATYDSRGNLYSGGTCFDVGFPTTTGVYDATYNGIKQDGRTDVVITKYDSSGTFLQYSTYIGGATSTEIVTSLVVDGQNDLLLYGATGSSDFPTTTNAYDKTFNGGISLHFVYNGSYFDNGTDIYVAKLNSTGSTLLASTFIGGSLNDGVNVNNDSVFISQIGTYEFPADSLQYNYGDQYRGEINVDQSGNAYIASSTRSSNFPIVNGFDITLGGEQDAIVFKFNPDFSQLLWSTYLGGNDNDAGYAFALDDSSNVYVTGGTRSTTGFPTTAGVLKPSYCGGKADGFITKIRKDGKAFLYSTFWGTTAYDQTYFVQLDKNNNVYVVGQTEGAMPVSTGVYKNVNSGQFITKINDKLNTLIFSTVFGNGNGQPNISPSAFLVDYCENIYVSGWGGKIVPPVTNTFSMPTSANAIDATTDGHNFYLIALSTNATSLLYATYFGGDFSWEHVDGGTSRFDKKGIVYQSVCAGCGGNDDFPVKAGCWPYTSPIYNPINPGAPSSDQGINMNSNCNNGTFKFDFQVPLAQASFTVNHFSGCAPLTVNFYNESSVGGSFLWDFGNNDTTSLIYSPSRTYPTPGVYNVKLIVKNTSSCNVYDTALQVVTVYPSIVADFDFVTTPCTNQILLSDSSKVAPISWWWDFGDGATSSVQNPSHLFASAGLYNISLVATNANGCKDTVVVQSNNQSGSSINPAKTICLGNTTQLLATGGYAYQWFPATGLSAVNVPNPIASPTVNTTYTATIFSYNATTQDSCTNSLSTLITVSNPSLYGLTLTTNQDTLLQGESAVLQAITDTTLSIVWSPSVNLNNSHSFNPIATPGETTTYTATITNSLGCNKDASITIYVHPRQCKLEDVFIPNTFTPNGDGKNDVLFVRGNSISELYFAVYNRWGEMIFETKDIKKGWDGIYKNKKADPAVFAWYLNAKCFNGEEIKKKGNVTLIR